MHRDDDMRGQRFDERAFEKGDHPVNNMFKVQTAKCKVGIILWMMAARFCFGQAPEQWHVLIEPKFLRPEVSSPIPSAERTVLVAGYLVGDEPVYFTKKQFDGLNVTFEKFMEKSLANATSKKVKAEFVRNSKKVIEYVKLSSDSPLTATSVLSPDFLKTFADILGPKILVAIPNRYTIYAFPSLTTDYKDYAPMILNAYRESAHPVSMEVFEVSRNGMKAVGAYEDP